MGKPFNGKQILVSVIVPVYNVEAYLRQCIDSILGQTYPHFELLLINDGSTDQSGRICREAADMDWRVHYYQKENGGLSDARNFGMERARGDYLTFIDSDDYVAETYLETLLHLCLHWSAGISCVDFTIEKERPAWRRPGGRIGIRIDSRLRKSKIKKILREECLTSVEALKRCLVRDGFGVSADGKMYHRSLIPALHFPEGRRYEDLLTIPYLFEKCDRTACCIDRLYHYRIREGSLTHRRLEEEDIRQTQILLDIIRYVDEYAPEIHDAAICRLTEDVFHNILYRLVYDDRYPKLAREIHRVCGKAFREGRHNPFLTRGKKLQLFVFCHFPLIYGPCIRCYLHGKDSLL